MGNLPMPRNWPKMSRKEERFHKQRLREQIKPLSVALIDQAKSFYTTVGQAISHWSHMEERLVQVAAKLLKTSMPKTGLIMYSIINFNVWLQIIDDLFVMDGTYPESMKLWRRILSAIKAEKDMRDRLAHHGLSQEEEIYRHVKGKRTILVRSTEAYLRPPKIDTRGKQKKMKPLTMGEIVDFTGRILDIHNALIVLLERMKQPESSR